MRVIALDHVVLICRDVEASLRWYADVLGLETIDVEPWRAGTRPFPSVRVSESTILDLLPGEPDGRNTDHLCLVLEPTDLEALVATPGLDVLEGPVERSGARGQGWSIYVHDPDAYVIELRHYGATPAGH